MSNLHMRYIIHRFAQVDSTNTVAARMAEDGAPEGTVVVAGEQTGGRGRHGRRWSSPPGTGLYLSAVLRPTLSATDLWQLGFTASLAAADAVRRVTGTDPRTKWPNDVLINGRKVCGILIEARLHPHTPTPPHSHTVIVGIGINVSTPSFPTEIADKATSLSIEAGTTTGISEVETALLDALDARYEQLLREGFPCILDDWRAIDCTAGREVSVQAPSGTVEGTALGVSPEGDLLVRRADGSVEQVTAGDVMLR